MREWVTARVAGDVSAMRHALVSPDRLRKAVDCPELVRKLTGAIENVGEAAKHANIRVEIRSMKATGQTKIAKGDNFRDCETAEPFEVRSYSSEIHIAAPGEEVESTHTHEVIRLDGRWYLLLTE